MLNRRISAAIVTAQQFAQAEPKTIGPARRRRAYVERMIGCGRWAGEDAYDAARGWEITDAMKAPAVLRALEKGRDSDD